MNSGKAFIPAALRAFARRSDEDASKLVVTDPHSILLIKHSERLGNVILMNSAINGLRSAFPNARIDLLAAMPFVSVLRTYTVLDEVIPLAKREFITKPWNLLSLLTTLRKRHYDIAIDCSDINSHSSTGAAYTLLSGARVTAGWRRCPDRSLYDIEAPVIDGVFHATAMYVRLMDGIFQRSFSGDFYLRGTGGNGPANDSAIGINCGGRDSKRWPLANFVELGRMLAADGNQIDFILGPDEQHLRSGLATGLPQNCRLLAAMPLEKLAEVIRGYRLFISSDTGPMHLAWCLRVPVLAIFTDSEIEKFRPLSPGSTGVDSGTGITVEMLYQEARSILQLKEIAR